MTTTNTSSTTPSLDVFILTFNAAKQQINPSIFAHHLRNAFLQNAAELPELVVFCLQEMAPLAHGFIGSYMISPFFQTYASAVNLAARSFVAGQNQQRDGAQDPNEPQDPPYTLVASRSVGMTGIMLFARDPKAVDNLQSTEVSFGAGSMANKGAVGLRLLYAKEDAGGQKRSTELTFVGAHLAAHEWNLEKRNRNWESLVTGLLFEDPGKLHNVKSLHPTPHAFDGNDEGEGLLSQEQNDKALHDITIYKPGSHLFIAGDLNYRISKTSPSPSSVFPDPDPTSPNYFKHFLARDQLTLEKAAGRTLHGLTESTILFPPTYKLDVADWDGVVPRKNGSPTIDASSWNWAPHRWPGWCDRVLYLDVPPWASDPAAKETRITTLAYDALPAVRTSDHRAVFLRLAVPVLEPSELAPPNELRAADSNDPRIKLPYPVDFQSWEHRAQVKKWEPMIGWSMLISQSKKGIALFIALFLVGLGTWWLRSR
ncbi:DNase I-like protein [Xylaria intraflava]|nr:DNase I-like protein [Xylaria intraflava]